MSEKTKIIPFDQNIILYSRKAIRDMLKTTADEGYTRIGIDLSSFETLDSDALGLIVYNYVIFKDLGVELFLVNPSPKVMILLDNTRLNNVLKVERIKNKS